ncbi:MAG: glycerophosphodiester phosphodiesterase [Clostridia bacterium]|nr:glycerophosphodiester phosphodiesterase [Clostridia bacterium]
MEQEIITALHLPAGFTVTAHAGAFNTPDNSLESVKTILKNKCELIETDVSFRPDGTPVIIHKDDPDADEGVLFADVLRLIAEDPDIRMNLDLKSVRNLPQIDRLLREYGLFERAFFTGVGEDWIGQVRSESAVPTFLNAEPDKKTGKDPEKLQALADKIRTLGAVGLNSHYSAVTPLCGEILHKNGLLLSVWTANDKRAIRRCLAARPDNITSRHPDLVAQVCLDESKKSCKVIK